MPTMPKFLASVLAAAALLLVGASSAFAAASPSSASLDDSFCIQSGPKEYCYDIDGTRPVPRHQRRQQRHDPPDHADDRLRER